MKTRVFYILCILLFGPFMVHPGKKKSSSKLAIQNILNPQKLIKKRKSRRKSVTKTQSEKECVNNITDLDTKLSSILINEKKIITLHEALVQEDGDTFYDLFDKDPEHNLNAQDDNGNTLLTLAIKEKLPIKAVYLLQHGADWDIKNNDGKTAHEYLIPEVQDKIIQALHWANDFFGICLGLRYYNIYMNKQIE